MSFEKRIYCHHNALQNLSECFIIELFSLEVLEEQLVKFVFEGTAGEFNVSNASNHALRCFRFKMLTIMSTKKVWSQH